MEALRTITCLLVSLFHNCNEHVPHQSKLLSLYAWLSIRSDENASAIKMKIKVDGCVFQISNTTSRKIS
jgi:hypothetical protein